MAANFKALQNLLYTYIPYLYKYKTMKSQHWKRDNLIKKISVKVAYTRTKHTSTEGLHYTNIMHPYTENTSST